MVFRVYVEKKKRFAMEADSVLRDIRDFLGIKSVTGLRLLNCYDAEHLSKSLFETAKAAVFSEPMTDSVYDDIPEADAVFGVEYLPGQYDQRADSAAQCIQFISRGERPAVKNTRVYLLSGHPDEGELIRIKRHLINPVESREAALAKPETLSLAYPPPEEVAVLAGFREKSGRELRAFREEYALAMDDGDLLFCQDYFKTVGRDPTETEIRVLDTYWSDHCRHTTFTTEITDVRFEDPAVERAFGRLCDARKSLGRADKPLTLMEIATAGMRVLRQKGMLPLLDDSEEINACTVRTAVDVDGERQDWLLLFKNETHNHPTEIEPFGGAATCIGGAIRDPLSGRAYVYQAMRVTGAADPTAPSGETLPGKLPQRRITVQAAAGYSSYGNQIGLATGQVDEIYHPGYAAKRMEIGAVVGAAPAENVVRMTPAEGDVVLLLGGRTGRDGVGGATGSSKTHDLSSLERCGAEVQKGNAPEERKLQRLFRNPLATRLIKRCNDFGAGGVSVAVGELADGLLIDLSAVPKKYEGLGGTELAISESQERMAVVVAPEDERAFIRLAAEENLEATAVARVTGDAKLTMIWNGRRIVGLDRSFLNTNGAPKTAKAAVLKQRSLSQDVPALKEGFFRMVRDLNCANKRGLAERFCSTVGAGTVLMPYGGRYQLTPAQCMAAKFPVLKGETGRVSVMAYGFNPYVSEASPYRGAYLAVVESLSRLAAAGAKSEECYLTFQEYFPRLREDAERWGRPLAALLGAFAAQLDFGVAAIGGKDSMSGSFEGMDVPPTLVSFAVSVTDAGRIISPEWKAPGHAVSLLLPDCDEETGLPRPESQKAVFEELSEAIASGAVLSAWAIGAGGAAEAVFKMSLGNRIGLRLFETDEAALFRHCYGGFVLELADGRTIGKQIGITTEDYTICNQNETISIRELQAENDAVLADVFPTDPPAEEHSAPVFTFTDLSGGRSGRPGSRTAKPLVAIPAFPGTNCEYDTARAFERAGARTEIFVINNLSPKGVEQSVDAFARLVDESQMVAIPGGFSGGDEPDGSGKFITAFFRNPGIVESVRRLLRQRDGLMLGICNGFQALVKLGLLPFGDILDTDASFPTLAVNKIGRHQSRMVDVRIASVRSPWLSGFSPGEIESLPVSHGEGRFVADDALLSKLAAAGQIATQYVDLSGNPTMETAFNPNGSVAAIEGILSPDGRIFGRMGHCERKGAGLYKNIDMKSGRSVFDGAVSYFR